jgi:hypothetical protein
MANLFKKLRGVNKLAALSFRDGRQELCLLFSVELKRLVAFVSKKRDGSPVRQVFAVDLDHAVIYFSGGDKHASDFSISEVTSDGAIRLALSISICSNARPRATQ